MFGEKRYPENLSATDLDAYLSRGWYRMGQSIFTTHFLCFNDQFYSALWVRLSLKDYNFSKSLRKIVRRNYKQFDIKFREVDISEEKEILFQKYKKSFPGHLAPSLEDSLFEGFDGDIFETYETSIYDGDQLIAFSFFDLGEDSVASILGVYDPDYNKHSLGLFTMLLEIIFCKKNDFQYFYPGYVVPGNSRFEYKKRIGDVDYFDLRTGHWLSYAGLKPMDIPLSKMENKLLSLQNRLSENSHSVNYYHYPLFEANLFGYWNAPYFDYPNFLLIKQDPKAKKYYVIVFDPREEAFLLIKCSEFDNVYFYFNSEFVNTFDKGKFFTELITTDGIIGESANEDDMVKMVNTLREVPVNEEK